MKIVVTQIETTYAPNLWWITSNGALMSIAEWREVAEDEDVTDHWTSEIEPLTDFDLEDFSGATEQEFGR